MRSYDFIGFDLDGTLVDSKPAVLECLRFVMPSFCVMDADEVVDQLFPLSLADFQSVLKLEDAELWIEFRNRYIARFDSVSYKFVKILPGAYERVTFVSGQLGAENIFVLTNRRLESAESILADIGLRPLFGHVVHATPIVGGGNPKTRALRKILRDQEYTGRGAYVGDDIRDAEAAIKNGLDAILVGLDHCEYPWLLDMTGVTVTSVKTIDQLVLNLEARNVARC